VYGKVTLHLPSISRIKASLHHMVERRLEDIHVVHEFPDVFPDDLLGMSPKRAIEFKIELQPGIAPISKAPYNMSREELAELKIQLKDLLDKGFFTQVHHLGVVQHCLYQRKIKVSVCVWTISNAVTIKNKYPSHASISSFIN
jgi:hypothetical protein